MRNAEDLKVLDALQIQGGLQISSDVRGNFDTENADVQNIVHTGSSPEIYRIPECIHCFAEPSFFSYIQIPLALQLFLLGSPE